MMAALKRVIVLVLVLAFGAVIFYGRENNIITSQQVDDSYTMRGYDSKVMVWVPYWDREAAFESLKKNQAAIDSIGLFWYLAKSDGSIKTYEYAKGEDEIIGWAKDNGKEIMAIITNLPEEKNTDWDDSLAGSLISSAAARQNHAKNIAVLLESKGYDGVQIDFESMRGDHRQDFTEFIKVLADELHQYNKIVGVDLLVKKSEGDPAYSNGSEAQDWEELAKHADQLYLMLYGEHWETSAAGPMAGLPWFETIVDYARQLIPAQKLYVGIPLYGYDWTKGANAVGLVHDEVRAIKGRNEAKVMWDEKEMSPYFYYQAGEVKHEVWFENAASIQAKLDILKEKGVRHTAVWRLGGEDKKLWKVLAEF